MRAWILMAAGGALLMTGCVSYPLGMSSAEWESLPAGKKAEYRAQQATIDQENQRRADEQRMQAERLRVEQLRQEQERIRTLYANARYGDIVQMNVRGGRLEYAGKFYPYEPVSFDLVRGETKEVDFRGMGMVTVMTHYRVRLSADGNTIYFDDSFRTRLVLVNDCWDRGQVYGPQLGSIRNDVGVGLGGMTFSVRFKQLPGAPQRIILERQ